MIPTNDLFHRKVWSDETFTIVEDTMPIFTVYRVYLNSGGECIGITNAAIWMPQCQLIMQTYAKNKGLRWMRQIKRKRPETMVLLRAEKGYLAYLEDADLLAQVTGESMGVSDDGVRYCHFNSDKLNIYLPRLIRKGIRVAIGDM